MSKLNKMKYKVPHTQDVMSSFEDAGLQEVNFDDHNKCFSFLNL